MNQSKQNSPFKIEGLGIIKDPTSPDKDADRTGTDSNADSTRIKRKRIVRYEKAERELNPDSTGIDTNADHTKKIETDFNKTNT